VTLGHVAQDRRGGGTAPRRLHRLHRAHDPPALGPVPNSKLSARTLETFYAELRPCALQRWRSHRPSGRCTRWSAARSAQPCAGIGSRPTRRAERCDPAVPPQPDPPSPSDAAELRIASPT